MKHEPGPWKPTPPPAAWKSLRDSHCFHRPTTERSNGDNQRERHRKRGSVLVTSGGQKLVSLDSLEAPGGAPAGFRPSAAPLRFRDLRIRRPASSARMKASSRPEGLSEEAGPSLLCQPGKSKNRENSARRYERRRSCRARGMGVPPAGPRAGRTPVIVPGKERVFARKPPAAFGPAHGGGVRRSLQSHSYRHAFGRDSGVYRNEVPSERKQYLG